MTIDVKKIELSPATERYIPIIRNMSKYYVYEIVSQCKTKHNEWKMDEEGFYRDLEKLETYWEEKDRYPFIVRYDSELAGFA